MAESDEGVGTAWPRRDSWRMPSGMSMVGRISGKRERKRAKRLDDGAEMEAKERGLG